MLAPGAGARPAAVCVGVGVALLASVSLSLSRSGPRRWLQRLQMTTAASRARPTVLRGRPSLAGDADASARLLPCAVELGRAGHQRLGKHKITVVQV